MQNFITKYDVYCKIRQYNLFYAAWKVSKYGVFSSPYIPIFGLNTAKNRPEKTPYMDTFHAVIITCLFKLFAIICTVKFKLQIQSKEQCP